MKFKFLLLVIFIMPLTVIAADRSSARVGMAPRASNAGIRSGSSVIPVPAAVPVNTAGISATVTENVPDISIDDNISCREVYRGCMDEFCLLDESEGGRCACSSNIEQSKGLINEIQEIQDSAEKLYTEGVEREKLGTRERRLVFGESENAKKSSRASGLSFAQWLNSDSDDDESLDADYDIGDNLYAMADEYCASKLAACDKDSEMEEMLYQREIVGDCKSFNTYLSQQKTFATANKAAAEKAVRAARLAMLDNTNKYNRGECLLAYKSCIADKGGCGVTFENCLDADLLGRRASACENVLDQCTAVKSYVLQDWEAESEMVLADAAKYADKNRRLTCFAKIQGCLEVGCSTESNSACLTDINVAAGICPVIDECNEIIPGIKNEVNKKLAYLRLGFCQNDVDKCLQDKCGKNYNAPECVGKKTADIIAMCPQTMFPSCSGEGQFDLIVQAALLQMDYQMMQGCINYFGAQLGAVCGADMNCLPTDDTVATLMNVPSSEKKLSELRLTVRENTEIAVEDFFKQFEKDITVSECVDSKKPAGRKKLGDTIFNSAKLVAKISAENRAMRQLETRISELSRAGDLEEAEKNCLTTYAVEEPNKSSKNYSYIKSVSFEPALRNCRVCRMQQVCETGGESKATSALKAGTGGLAAGAGAGTAVSPGWGTAIGGVVGVIGGVIGGIASGGEESFCQEIESCEDISM